MTRRLSQVRPAEASVRPGSLLIVMRTSMVLPNQFPGVHDARGVELGLDGAQGGDAAGADLALQIGNVVAADGVVVAERAAVGDDGLAGRVLGRRPLLDLRSALLPGEEREVEGAAGRVEVRDVAPDDRRRVAGVEGI